MTGNSGEELVHGTAVAIGKSGVLIVGDSGSGKSALALELMSRGASLVSDDRTMARRAGTAIVIFAPPGIKGMIEARGIGILGADAAESASLKLVVDLSRRELERLPPERKFRLLGVETDLIHGAESRNLAAAVAQFLKCGRRK